MTLIDTHHVVTGWYPSEITDHADHIGRMLTGDGRAFGAWHGAELVGIAALDVEPVGGDPRIMRLEPLHVSASWRHRGIGTRLVALVAEAAQSLGATSLYISSIPTRNAVNAYLRMGARLLDRPDPILFAKEPEDIHLLLEIPPFLAREAARRRR